MNIPFARPMLSDAERSAVNDVMNGTILTHGPNCSNFESNFADYVGAEHAVTTSNCTTALHLGLTSLGVGVSDEVIVPAMTHVASAHAVEHCGAVPIFVDIDIETGCIDPKLIEEKNHAKTKIIIVVHFIGLPCDMASINAVAEKYNIDVIEDSATALGAKYNNKFAGSLGKLGCFSFYPTKHITSLEGGMLTTDDDHVAAKVRSQRAFGYDKGLGERQIAGVYDIASLVGITVCQRGMPLLVMCS
jgi:perosamine synthetase